MRHFGYTVNSIFAIFNVTSHDQKLAEHLYSKGSEAWRVVLWCKCLFPTTHDVLTLFSQHLSTSFFARLTTTVVVWCCLTKHQPGELKKVRKRHNALLQSSKDEKNLVLVPLIHPEMALSQSFRIIRLGRSKDTTFSVSLHLLTISHNFFSSIGSIGL